MSVKIRWVTLATFLASDAGVTAFPAVAEALAAAVAARRGDPEARLAIHTGEAWEGFAGPGVSRALRLREIANPGQTLVSAAAAADGPELHDLGLHRLRDLSPPLRVFALEDGPPPRSLDATPNNLPSRPTTFVGREAELADLHARVAGARLLTIAGPGGSGKTRLLGQLAAEQAGRWPDGVWWVELGALADPQQVGSAVAEATGVLVDPARGEAASLRSQLAGRRLLLCLDNCEHVLDAAAEVADCLRACPEVAIVAHQPRAARADRRDGVAARRRCRRRTRGRCSSSGPRSCSPTWRSTRRPTRRSSRCARGSTGRRWRSSSPRRGRGR